jgi:serine/threonine-protein kinase RsbW
LRDGFAIELDNDLAEIERFDRLVRAFAARNALTSGFASQVTLALDELLTNVISYGFPQGGRHKISLTLAIDDGGFTAEMVDGGVPFDPLARPAPDTLAPLEERDIGGLGIHFVRKAMDSLDYRREKDQNRLFMTKRIAADQRQE